MRLQVSATAIAVSVLVACSGPERTPGDSTLFEAANDVLSTTTALSSRLMMLFPGQISLCLARSSQ